jgi:hypothetical protein
VDAEPESAARAIDEFLFELFSAAWNGIGNIEKRWKSLSAIPKSIHRDDIFICMSCLHHLCILMAVSNSNHGLPSEVTGHVLEYYPETAIDRYVWGGHRAAERETLLQRHKEMSKSLGAIAISCGNKGPGPLYYVCKEIVCILTNHYEPPNLASILFLQDLATRDTDAIVSFLKMWGSTM